MSWLDEVERYSQVECPPEDWLKLIAAARWAEVRCDYDDACEGADPELAEHLWHEEGDALETYRKVTGRE